MKLFSLVASWVIVSAVGLAQGFAQIVAEPASLDLGRKPQNQELKATVALVNKGDKPVRIFDVQADCSCTAGTPEKSELAPGERTELLIRLETRTSQGEIVRRIGVQTSSGDLTVPVKVLVTPYERWSLSRTLLTLGPSRQGQEARTETMLTYLETAPVDVTGVETSVPWVAADISRRNEKEFAITLIKKIQAPAGNHMVTVSVLTNDPVNPRVEFSAFVAVSSSVQVKPSPLVLPVGRVGQETRLKGEILGWDGDLPPRLELARGTASVTGTGTEGLAFELAMTPEQPGASTQLLRVYAGDELKLEVPVILRVETSK
jgi:hypothetical protein